MQGNEESEALARSYGQLRRAIWRDFARGLVRSFGDFEFSLVQMVTLLLLDEEGELPIKQVAAELGRSVSATGRMLDQLVKRGLVSRRENEGDRRQKLVAITEGGRTLLAAVERRRVDAQLAIMQNLSAEERAEVMRAMTLLAEAGERRLDEQANAPSGSQPAGE
jgi:DNA-binding MarR family transcriptional regulator